MMRKRIVTALLSVCLAVCLLPVCALAADTASGTCGDNLTWTLREDGTLTISGTGAMTDYGSAKEAPWYGSRSSIKTVILESGVTSVGESAFDIYDALESVTIPDGVISIGDRAFYGCDALTSITLPDSVTSIGGSAFAQSNALENVTLGNGVQSIGSMAFQNCNALKNITIPGSVTSIGSRAFIYCSALESVTIPDGVTNITGYVFAHCSALKSVTIPDSVTNIRDYAFAYCSALTDVYYKGAEDQWDAISFGSNIWYGAPVNCSVHYNSAAVINPFTDVAADNWFYDSVLWAVNKGITLGTSETTFSPDNGCTRAQIVTFLWRSAGSPAPTMSDNPFADVSTDDWYYNAVLWAVENGITAGTSATTFSPNDTCLRSQAMTFIWRANSKPAAGSDNPFTDIASGKWYTDAVLWAVANNITLGTSATTFGPNDTCTRGQIVTFLYRAA